MPNRPALRATALVCTVALTLGACASDNDTSPAPTAQNNANGESTLELPPFEVVQTVRLSATGDHDRLLGAAF